MVKVTYNFTVEQFEDYFKKTFVDESNEKILYDVETRSDDFLKEAFQYGVNQEWLEFKRVVGEVPSLELTDKGKRYFGLEGLAEA